MKSSEGYKTITEIAGNVAGLKSVHLHNLERIFRRRVDVDELASWELVKLLTEISRDIRRQIGICIDRKGKIETVFVGENRSIQYPKFKDKREGTFRLNGYRIIHTCLDHKGLSQNDLSELGVKRFDMVATIEADEKGFPGIVHVAHVAPNSYDTGAKPIEQLPPSPYPDLQLNVKEFIESLEEALAYSFKSLHKVANEHRAIFSGIRTDNDPSFEDDLNETLELAGSLKYKVVENSIQKRDKPDPKYLVGEGRYRELISRAGQLGCDTLIFHQNLTPNQIRHMTDLTPMEILDRTQIILDIFSKRAKTHEGKLQVELAYLRYAVPRLRERESKMSRIVGGIGGRGPGETAFEEQRRRAKDLIHRKEKEIENLAKKRFSRRQLRNRSEIPVISIVGYTNAGKSTLLNSLTKAEAFTENLPFATLDPYSKRMRFPHDRDVIFTDTVGFIRDLPKELMFAFRATLEEIGDADLLVHVVDASRSDYENRIQVVHEILAELEFSEIPEILVFNKADRLEGEIAQNIANKYDGVALTALKPNTCHELLEKIEKRLWT